MRKQVRERVLRIEKAPLLITTVVGNYTKIGPGTKAPSLRNAINQLDRGRITEEELRRVEDEVTREVIQEQIDAGIDLVTDGQIRWDDGQTYFARGIKGFSINGLIRYFDSNTYYRRPVAEAKLEWDGPSSAEHFKFARANSTRPVKAVITGPYTVARLSQKGSYPDLRSLVLDLAGILNREARALQEAGATVMIAGLYEGLPAHRAGIRQYDILLSLNGETPVTRPIIFQTLRELEPGSEIELTVIQAGETIELTVTLEAFDSRRMRQATLIGESRRGRMRGTLRPSFSTGMSFQDLVIAPDSSMYRFLPLGSIVQMNEEIRYLLRKLNKIKSRSGMEGLSKIEVILEAEETKLPLSPREPRVEPRE